MFDPASILFAAKSGSDPSAYTVFRPDPAHFRWQRFWIGPGRVVAIIFAVIWFLLIPTAFPFPSRLALAGLCCFGFPLALFGLAEAFVMGPRRLERQSREALILTPDGLILADWEQSAVLQAIDYRAPGKLTLEVLTDTEAPDRYYLVTRGPGETKPWMIEEYFETSPKEIASRVMRDYGRSKAPG